MQYISKTCYTSQIITHIIITTPISNSQRLTEVLKAIFMKTKKTYLKNFGKRITQSIIMEE